MSESNIIATDQLFPGLAAVEQAAGIMPEPRPSALILILAGKTYTIPRKFAAENREWRKQLRSQVGPIQAVMELMSRAKGETWSKALNALDTSDIATAMGAALPAMLSSVDDLADLLFAYDPALGDNRAAILAGAYDEDLLDAFLKVLQVAYPIKKLTAAYGSAMNAAATT